MAASKWQPIDLLEEQRRLRDALEDVLSRFGNDEAIKELTPEGAESVRPWPMFTPPKVSDVRRWRAALTGGSR